jgi:hypothetical protein
MEKTREQYERERAMRFLYRSEQAEKKYGWEPSQGTLLDGTSVLFTKALRSQQSSAYWRKAYTDWTYLGRGFESLPAEGEK